MIKIISKEHRIQSESGSTLVEVMFCVAVLAVVAVGAIGTFAKCSAFAENIREHTIVKFALNERMEEMRDMSYNTIINLNSFCWSSIHSIASHFTSIKPRLNVIC